MKEREGQRERENKSCVERAAQQELGPLVKGCSQTEVTWQGRSQGVVYFHLSFFPLPDLLALFPIVGTQLGNRIARGLLGPNKGTFS